MVADVPLDLRSHLFDLFFLIFYNFISKHMLLDAES